MAIQLQYTSKGSEEWAKQVVSLAKANLIRGKKRAAGTLYNSVSYKIDPGTLQIDFYYEDYGEDVERGRKPGKFPPPPAIAAWAKVKGIPQFRDKKGRYISNDSRTFLLSRAIAKKGIRPFPFFTDAIEDSITQLYSKLEDGVVADIENSLEI